MRVLLQRVLRAAVRVEDQTIGEIGQGLLLLVGLGKGDDQSKIRPLAEKISKLRVFADQSGKFNHSIIDIGAEALCVSQFTLYGETNKGLRPDFGNALEPAQASALFDQFVAELRALGVKNVATGKFGAYMIVSLENDGPVTFMIEN